MFLGKKKNFYKSIIISVYVFRKERNFEECYDEWYIRV